MKKEFLLLLVGLSLIVTILGNEDGMTEIDQDSAAALMQDKYEIKKDEDVAEPDGMTESEQDSEAALVQDKYETEQDEDEDEPGTNVFEKADPRTRQRRRFVLRPGIRWRRRRLYIPPAGVRRRRRRRWGWK